MRLLEQAKMVAQGKSLARIAMNKALAATDPWSGVVLDVGGTQDPAPSYRRYFPLEADCQVVCANLSPAGKPDYVADAAELPLPDNSVDGVWCLNLLEHVEDPSRVVNELHRVAKPGARVVIATPFLVCIHDDPADYHRFTPAAMRVLLERAGFAQVAVRALAGGPWSAAYNQIPGFPPWFGLLLLPSVVLLDRLWLRRLPHLRQKHALVVLTEATK